MGKKKKFYVVWQGVEPGIYKSWGDCQLQIKGYPNAKYKSFPSLIEAQEAYSGGVGRHLSPKKSKDGVSVRTFNKTDITLPSWSVDAACSGNPGKMEYRGVETENANEIFHLGPLEHGTNNIGEFLALVHALALLQKHRMPQMPIYSDSRIAIGWIKKKKCNTKLEQNAKNKKIFMLIDRAEHYLATNKVTNPILKWETKTWGEIPADFGRK